jgi:hypothetical protein
MSAAGSVHKRRNIPRDISLISSVYIHFLVDQTLHDSDVSIPCSVQEFTFLDGRLSCRFKIGHRTKGFLETALIVLLRGKNVKNNSVSKTLTMKQGGNLI